jgi:hypothetical protein
VCVLLQDDANTVEVMSIMVRRIANSMQAHGTPAVFARFLKGELIGQKQEAAAAAADKAAAGAVEKAPGTTPQASASV